MVREQETRGLDKEMPTIFDKKAFKNIALAFIIFSLVLSAFLINYGVKIRNDEYCTSSLLVDERTSQSIDYSGVLDSNNDYLLQKFFWHPNDYHFSKDYYFCYTAIANTSSSLSLEIIDQEENVLAIDNVLNGSVNNKCVYLTNKLSLDNGDFVGLKCLDCNITETLTIKQHLLGDDQEIMTNSSYSVDKGLFYDFIYTSDCKPLFKSMINVFFTVAGLLLLVIIILIGVNWLRGVLSKGWGF